MTEAAPHASGLLESFMSAALADDYADVAPPVESARRGPVFVSALALVAAAAIGLLITSVLISNLGANEQRERTRGALADRVTTATATVAERQSLVNAKQAHVSDLERQVLADGDVTPGIREQADALAATSGTLPLTGAGVEITVDDAPDATANSLNQVLDRDLQDIANALWREGATGIAINGHRLISTTAIRSAGEAIVVNYEPLARPYRVEAVGAGAAVQSSSGVGRLLAHLGSDYGLVAETKARDVALPAGELHQPRFAMPSPAPASGGVS
ncbi:MAG: DUF881 domain-containing protein [Actinomycetes bacterium]